MAIFGSVKMTPEGRFKARCKKRIKSLFPGCWFHEMKCGNQGIPDTLIIFKSRWALLEFKESEHAYHRPNQEFYVKLFDGMGFSRFIYPENEHAVLEALSHYFKGA